MDTLKGDTNHNEDHGVPHVLYKVQRVEVDAQLVKFLTKRDEASKGFPLSATSTLWAGRGPLALATPPRVD